MKFHNVFVPLPWQKPILEDTSLICLLHGTAGGGKTRVGLEKMDLFARHYPGSSILFVKKSFSTIHGTLLLPFEKDVIRGATDVKILRAKSEYIYKNGSRIFCAGMLNDKERERVRGIGQKGGLDAILADELTAFTVEDFDELLGRLRGPDSGFRQFLGMTNPGAPGHWVNQRLILGKEATEYFSSYQQNHYNPDDYSTTLQKMGGVLGLRLREGKWVQASGAVYPTFDVSFHVIKRFYLPPHWRRIRCIDFGYKNPFVCQWWAIDPDGAMYLYRELYRTEELVEDMTKLILKLTGDEKIEATVRDHDAEDAATMERHGILTTLAYKHEEPGRQAVLERLQKMKNGKARLYIFEDCLVYPDEKLIDAKKIYSTTQEFDSYVYEKAKDGKPSTDRPLKQNDHGMDAMRYGVSYVDNVKEKFDLPATPQETKMLSEVFSKEYESKSPFFKKSSNANQWWPGAK